MDYFLERRQKLLHSLIDANLDAFLISNPLNVTYFTGFTGDSSYLVVTPSKVLLVSDDRFAVQIREEVPQLETFLRGHDSTTARAVGGILNSLGVRTVGIEGTHLTLTQYEQFRELCPTLDFSSQPSRISRLRAIKDVLEIAQIREAAEIGARAFELLRANLHPTATEKNLADAMEGYIRSAGGRGSSFPTIIGIGERSALPHCPPSQMRIEQGEFLLVDWGAAGPLYTSDLTRVIPSPFRDRSAKGREVETRLEKIYTVVLQAQTRAIARLGPGVPVREVDAAARGWIEQEGFGEAFNHGLGHGIGLQVHEGPDIRSISPDVLEVGNVVTIEPGIYIPGFGGVRIEDDILITEDGHEVLSSVPKQWSDYWN